jgi:O-antigen/teichoic acid export membrane protein
MMLKKIVREANFLSLAGNISISFFGFAGFALLAREFAPDEFGRWVIFISASAFMDMLRFGIITTPVIRYLSGAADTERKKYTGSFIFILLVATTLITLVLWSCLFLFPAPIYHSGYDLFFIWYPIIGFILLPFNTAQVIMMSEVRFDRLLLVNCINSFGFFLVVVFNFIVIRMSLTQLLLAQTVVSLIASLFCIFNGWDGFRYLFHATGKTNKVLLDYGKFTTLTLIGTSLLRSADTLIISISPMGTAAVALYAIPMKLTELQQLPLRSFAATAFPKMSKASLQERKDEVRDLFYTYSGAMTYLFAFISLVTFMFAPWLVLILGGHQYLSMDMATGGSTVLLVRIFSIYGLFLPIERMTGIGLDSVNRPDRNFQKVLYMTITNVIGDLIAVYIFRSLEAVAIGSIIFTLFGIWLGYYFLDREIGLSRTKVFSSGIEFYKTTWQSFRHMSKQGV